MSRLPQLEAQLVAAAAGRPRPRDWRPRIAIGLVAAACAAVALLTVAPRREEAPAGEGVAPVPAQTLERSRALAAAPEPERNLREEIPHAGLAGVAATLQARTPYPPGMRDDFDWAATPADPQSMGSINFIADAQSLVEYRAYCLWLRYWVSAQGSPDALGGANAVLADIPSWPTRRASDGYIERVIAAARRGDAAPVRHEIALNCAGVQ